MSKHKRRRGDDLARLEQTNADRARSQFQGHSRTQRRILADMRRLVGNLDQQTAEVVAMYERACVLLERHPALGDGLALPAALATASNVDKLTWWVAQLEDRARQLTINARLNALAPLVNEHPDLVDGLDMPSTAEWEKLAAIADIIEQRARERGLLPAAPAVKGE